MKKHLVLYMIFIFMVLTGCGSNNKGPFTFQKEDGITIVYSGDKPAHGKIVRKDTNGYTHNYQAKKGIINGKYNIYFPNGNLCAKTIYKKGKIEGASEEYYENGQIKRNSNYDNGELEGIFDEYYETGEIKIKSNYNNGSKNGSSEEYYRNGQIKIASNYNNNELNGTYEKYLENGQIKIRSNYKNGQLDGTQEQYSENGELEIKNNYANGEYHGEQYFSKGKSNLGYRFIEESIYEHGKPTETKLSIDKDSDDSILSIFFQKDRRRSVTGVTTYYDSGNVKEIIYYDENDVMTTREKYKDKEFSNFDTTITYDVKGNVLLSW